MHSYEKSMYQIISQEMLKMLAGVEAFNTLIGEPVYKYRQDYKSLEKLRDRFFAKVENEIDFEKFVEYYKWIDKSLSGVLEQFQPATAAMNIGLEDVVESPAFESQILLGKYWESMNYFMIGNMAMLHYLAIGQVSMEPMILLKLQTIIILVLEIQQTIQLLAFRHGLCLAIQALQSNRLLVNTMPTLRLNTCCLTTTDTFRLIYMM